MHMVLELAVPSDAPLR